MDFFKKVISSVGITGLAPGFPYALDSLIAKETEVGVTSGIWSMHSGHKISLKKSEPIAQVTIFIADLTQNDGSAAAARNSLKWLKILRHPKILKIYDGVEADGKIYIATEAVVPFVHATPQEHDMILWNLVSLIEGLKFINEDAKVILGNLRKSSLFLDPAGELKIWGFEVATSISDNKGLLTDAHRILNGFTSQSWPEELRKISWQEIRGLPIHSIDAWMLSRLVEEMFPIKLPKLARFCSQTLQCHYSQRPSPSMLLEPSFKQELFRIPLVNTDEQLESLSAADLFETEHIILSIQKQLSSLPDKYLKCKLLPRLISLLEFRQTSLEGIKLVISIGEKLSEFDGQLEAFIVFLFAKPDRAVRLVLLDNIELIINMISQKSLQDYIFGHFCSGFADTMPEMREKTLKASVLLAPKLTSRQINNDLVRHYSRFQSDEQPGIRVNSIICLGKISPLLDPNLRQKVFMVSIGKALQDPFPPARSSALRTLMVTMESFSDQVLARNLLPLVCVMLVDKDKSVNDQAFLTMRAAVNKLERAKVAKTTADASKEELFCKEPSPEQSSDSSRRESVGKKAAEWGSWGLSSLTSQVNKIQQSLTNIQLSPKQEVLSVSLDDRQAPLLHDKSSGAMKLERTPPTCLTTGWEGDDGDLPTTDEEVVDDEEDTSEPDPPVSNLTVIHSGWDAELDPWSAK